MNKKICIVDYKSNRIEVKIKDFERIVGLFVEVKIGDELIHVLYEDGKREFLDSSSRRTYESDGSYFVIPKDIEEWNSCKGSSYDRMNFQIHKTYRDELENLKNDEDNARE